MDAVAAALLAAGQIIGLVAVVLYVVLARRNGLYRDRESTPSLQKEISA